LRLAVISDIHGNLEAFKQVIVDMEDCHLDQVVCLGDMIGYGPEPEAVVRLIRERNIPSIMGNHELAMTNRRYLKWFNPLCRQSLLKTRTLLSDDTIHFIRSLKPNLTLGDSLLVHGCPPDSILTYLYELSDSDLRVLFQQRSEKKFFVGHTHDLLLKAFFRNKISSRPLTRGTMPFRKNQEYLVNVGSVGQPRDGNNQAKYVIWDEGAESLEVRFVPYDIARTTKKIIKLGLPETHAKRLW
jgi:predicted phosphodiesterase